MAEEGILGKAEEASDTQEKAEARDLLELTLEDLQIDKLTNKKIYNDEYVDTKLLEKNMLPNGDIVTVNGWQFQIDKSVPKIIDDLGKGKINEKIQINATSQIKEDYTSATVTVDIVYEGIIKSVTFGGEEIQKGEDGRYIVEGIEQNKTYVIVAKDSEGNLKIQTVKVTGISTDLNIYNAEQLAAFRDRVNKGATYKGRTIKVMDNIDLSTECGKELKSWEAIGTETMPFLGTFNGNNKTISNLYINTSIDNQGLFGYTSSSSIIENVILEDITVKSTGNNIGGLIGYTDGTVKYIQTIQTKEEDVIVSGSTAVGGIVGNSTILF